MLAQGKWNAALGNWIGVSVHTEGVLYQEGVMRHTFSVLVLETAMTQGRAAGLIYATPSA